MLAVLGVLSSVVAAYYYLRVIKVMFFEEARDAFDAHMPISRFIVLCISVAFITMFIFSPSLLIDRAQGAVAVLLAQ